MGDYAVDRIPGSIFIDPEAGGEEHRRRRDHPAKKPAQADSVSISDEALRRCRQDDEERDGEPAG
ncbi:hypothetical protein L4X63_05695 [Geomonas sp. Red32]|uniref:hypothetical protein n=1 Tax=Geomonas sp. Red32 TaxID=2912856 RepID=UPI00202CFBB7|nr:hypothetical protein [Geomonas sp. Red32]MCM0081077.1 hypothetical protein [Geomonas sp. Red32]